MKKVRAFDNIDKENIAKLLNCFESTKIHYNRNTTILSNLSTSSTIGVIESGSADVIRYNYDGSKTYIETLEEGDIFGSFTGVIDEGLYIISNEESSVITFTYDKLITPCKKNCPYHLALINNTIQLINAKLSKYNERIEILTKKTIRDKLLSYFNNLVKRQFNKTIILPNSLTNLAEFLAIDRSAMMREIKNLKEEGLIESQGRKIIIKY